MDRNTCQNAAMPAVRFGVLCLPNVPWDVLVERVARVERLGFDVAALPDHFVDWTNPPSPWFEGWTALTGLAATPSTIRLATCVTQIPFRNPAVFARQALTLDHISGGRLEIGLGTGLVGDPSYAMAGIEDWEPRERVDRLAEYAEIVDRLLRDEVTTFVGTYYRADGAIVNPRPVQEPRPPLTIGALGPVMLRHAARLATSGARSRSRIRSRSRSWRHAAGPRRWMRPARRSDATRPRFVARTRCTTRRRGHAAGPTHATNRPTASRRWRVGSWSSGWTRSSCITRRTSGRWRCSNGSQPTSCPGSAPGAPDPNPARRAPRWSPRTDRARPGDVQPRLQHRASSAAGSGRRSRER